jgi:hypothetical protein
MRTETEKQDLELVDWGQVEKEAIMDWEVGEDKEKMDCHRAKDKKTKDCVITEISWTGTT